MIGNQIPRIRVEPPRVDTDGAGAAILMRAYGVQLDEWQQLVLDCILGKDAADRYTASSCGISVARQNGKNVILEARSLYGLLVNGERILWTAHQGRTVKKAFRRLASIFESKNHPEILALVKKVVHGTGEEAILLTNGGMIEFTARSRQAARGFDGISLVIFDEAQELTDDQSEAIMATLSASTTGTRQMIYAGTPPYPGCPGEVFRRIRSACILSADKQEQIRNSWHEWSIPADTLAGIDLSDKQLWHDCNPALGTRLTVEFTTEEYKTLSADGFARERLGFWSKPTETITETAIPVDVWDSCMSDDPKPQGKTAYGIKFSLDGSEVALAGAIIPKTGAARITLLAIEPVGNGISWLAKWLNERYKVASAVAIDGRNGTDVLIDKIRPAGGGTWAYKDAVIKPKALDVVAAASGLLNDLNEQTVTWYKDQDELRESAITATKRPISGGFGFGGQTSTPIEAAALALWAAKTSRRDPTRQMRLG